MPDASISSTESTFGTISGTFTADQSTISGTVYAITGTVDGSVGVPGPQGQPGPQGPEGPPGPPGTGGTWGSITGTLSNQTDLQNALDAKQNVSGMSAYLTKAGNLTGLTDLAAARDNLQLGLSSSVEFFTVTANTGSTTTILGDGLEVFDGVNPGLQVTKTGIRFDDLTVQTTAYPGPAGATTWGSIVGTLSNQTDLQTALNGKAPSAAGMPISGTVGQVLTKQSGTSYDAAWATLIPGDRYLTSSTTSLTIDNNNKTLTVGTGLSYTTQQDIVISYDATRHMHARVLTYNSGTGVMDVDVLSHSGAGTYAAWTVNVGGTPALTSVVWGDITGTLGDQADLATALNAKLDSSTAASTYRPFSNSTFNVIDITASNFLRINDNAVYTEETILQNNGLLIRDGTSLSILARFGSNEVLIPSVGITFSDATTQTTAGLSPSTAASTYQTIAGMSSYLTTSAAASTYQTIAGMSSYLTTAAAASTYAPLAGATFTGLVSTLAPTTATAGLRLPHGTAPTTPVNGDLFTTTSGLFARINGTTRQYVDLDGTQTINGAKTFSNANQTIGNSTAAGTIAIGTGATISGSTRTINIGTASAAGSINAINIGGGSGTSTTTLNGTTNGVTVAADTNSVALATTAYVVGQAGSATPLVNGTAAVGTSLRYARQDHVHQTDTTRAALAGATFAGLVSTPASAAGSAGFRLVPGVAPTTPSNGDLWATTNDLQVRLNGVTETLAEQSWVTAQGYITSSALSPYLLISTAASTYATLASPTLTGTPTAPTATAGTNTTQIATTAFVQAAVSGGSGAVWGSITGTLSSQTDLQTALNAKLDSTTAASTYQTITGMSSYLTTASAASTYAPLASPTFTGTVTIPAGASISGYATTASLASYAPLASPALTGTPTSTTALADTNTTQVATTAFVVGQASATTPLVNGTAAVGTSLRYARADHVHGTDTTRAPLASPTFTGTPAAPTATAGTSTTQLATTAFVTTADNLKANLASPTFTGTPTAPTATAGTNTTQIATTAFVRADNNVKAWVNFNGTGTVAIRASFNVSSITDNGVGDYTVNFTTAMADANYSAIVTAKDEGGNGNWSSVANLASPQTTTSVRIVSRNATAGVDPQVFNVAIFR